MYLYIMEFKIQLKHQLKSIIIWNLLLLGIGFLYLYIPKFENTLSNVQVLLDQIPQAMAGGLKFVNRQDIDSITKVIFLLFTFSNLPMINRAFRMTAHALENGEKMGTVAFIQNRVFTKKQIVIAKYLAGMVTYATFLCSMFLSALILYVLSSEKKSSFGTTAGWFSTILIAMFLVGLFFMAIGLLYASIKSKQARVEDFIASVMLVTTFVGGLPSLLQFIIMILERVEIDPHIVVKLLTMFPWVKYIGVPFWSFPQYVYEDGIRIEYLVVLLIGIILCSTAGIFFYSVREQGEEL